jgi:hypothetical protein
MKKISSITALGLLIMLVASKYVAISRDWKEIILIICGLAVFILSLLLRQELHKVLRALHGDERISIKDTYVENNPQ